MKRLRPREHFGVKMNKDLFNVRSEQRGHAAHLRLSGELDMATFPVLERSLGGAESNGFTAIVLDLQHLTFMDVSGLDAFLRAAERASRSGRDFSVQNAPSIVRRLLEITQTTHLLGADQPALSDHRA
jgi:anti-sigma B factor antagonist